MKKIKVLMVNQIYREDIYDACIGYVDYDDKMRIEDLIKICSNDEQFFDYKWADKIIDPFLEINLLSKYHHEQGVIDWNVNVNQLYVKKIKEYTGKDFITIQAHGGIGDANGDALFGYIIGKIFDFIIKKIKENIITYKRAVEIIENESGKDFEYIDKIIYHQSNWKEGFISNKDFKHKRKVEKKIMKRIGYKLNSGIWEN